MATLVKKQCENVKTIANEFRCFRKSSLVFSSHSKRLINHYPEQWVAVYDGKVVAYDKNYDIVLNNIDNCRIPRKLVLLRYISKKPSTMVL